jgi:hypothetical protein
MFSHPKSTPTEHAHRAKITAPQPVPPSTTKEGKLSYWQLTHDRLQHFEIPWREEPDHFDRLLTALSCVMQFSLGTRGSGLWVDVYRNKKATAQLSFQYLVTLNTPNDSDTILVDDLPDLLNMLEHLAPIIELSMASHREESSLAQQMRIAAGEAGSSGPAH